MSSATHLIWDWNGTLFDDLHIVVESVNESLAAVSGGTIDADGYRDSYRRPVRHFYDLLLGHAVTNREWKLINARFHDAYLAALPRARPAKDAHAAARRAAALFHSQSILSMWAHDLLVPTVARHGFESSMVAVLGADAATGDRKEDLLRRHLGDLGMMHSKTVMVGDTFDDAAASESVGIGCVLYNGGSHHRVALEATGLPIADSLVEAVEIASEL